MPRGHGHQPKRESAEARLVPPKWLRPGWWPENVRLGATVVNQKEADRDITTLLALPAWVRFLSLEPLLSSVDLCGAFGMWWNQTMQCFEASGQMFNRGGMRGQAERGIAWVIIGGESGREARAMHVQWARDIVAQCRAAGVPVLVKQLGAQVAWDGHANFEKPPFPAGIPRNDTGHGYFRIMLADKKGGDMAEWPEDLRVREFPCS